MTAAEITVSFETAKKMYEAGWDKDTCFGWYDDMGTKRVFINYCEACDIPTFLEKDPENFKALLYKANVLFFMDLPEDALNYFEEALIQNPDSPEAWNYKGCVLSSLGKSKEAITSFKRAIKSSPEYVAAYLNLANVYKELNMLKNAKKSLDKVLKISPDNEEALKENESLKMNN